MKLSHALRWLRTIPAALLVFALFLAGPTALAQGPNTLDPTEPTAQGAVIKLSGDKPDGESGDGTGPAHDEQADDEAEDLSAPGDPWGDVGEGGLLTMRALFRARYISTFARSSTSERESYRFREEWLARQNDGFALNRVFLRFGSDPSRYLSFKAVLDIAELIENDPEDVLRQAYATFRPIPKHLEIMVGQFKVPFSVLELDASSRFEFAELGASNELVNRLGYAGGDLGVQILAAPLRKAKRLRLSVGAFRGRAYREHASPVGSLGGRIETKPNKHFRFGADVMHHTKTATYKRPFNTSNNDVAIAPPDPSFPNSRTYERGTAYSADARYKRKGFMLRAEAMYGTRVDYDTRYGAKTFWAAWGLAAYRIDLGPVQLLPTVRYEWFDANIEKDTGVYVQFTGAITALFMERVRVILDVTATDVQEGTPILNQPRPLQADPYLELDNVRGTLQLQVEL